MIFEGTDSNFHFDSFPFQVTYEPNVPAIILPKKPKYWLLGADHLEVSVCLPDQGIRLLAEPLTSTF